MARYRVELIHKVETFVNATNIVEAETLARQLATKHAEYKLHAIYAVENPSGPAQSDAVAQGVAA